MTGPLTATTHVAFALHPGAWVAVLAATAVYAWLIRREAFAVTRRQAWSFLGAMGVCVVALTWPVADLAAHHLLLALVVQRLLLMLAVPPLAFAGMPRAMFAAATGPRILDSLARTLSRPVPAIAVVTVVAVGTLVVPAVDAQASSAFTRGAFDLLLVGAGCALWLPVLHPVPGMGRLSVLGVAAYLIVQSIVPSFLSIVWIFARHPLYPAYAHAGKLFGISPLLDQQLSGFLAKLGTIGVLWTVAFVTVTRSEGRAEEGLDDRPLTWADVERELERIARRERRGTGPPVEAPLLGGDPGRAGEPEVRRRPDEADGEDGPARA